MNDIIMLALATTSGICLGIFYFGGLWLTLKQLPGSGRPALLALGSFLVRSGACILGFYLLSSNGLGALIFSLAGFVFSKFALISRLGSGKEANRW